MPNVPNLPDNYTKNEKKTAEYAKAYIDPFEKHNAVIKLLDSGSKEPTSQIINDLISDNEFQVNLLVNGTPNTETLNKLTLYIMDEAGYESPQPLNVYVDLLPPAEPTVTFLSQ